MATFYSDQAVVLAWIMIIMLTATVATAARPAATAATASSSVVGAGATEAVETIWGDAGAEAERSGAEEALRGQHLAVSDFSLLGVVLLVGATDAATTEVFTAPASGMLGAGPPSASGLGVDNI